MADSSANSCAVYGTLGLLFLYVPAPDNAAVMMTFPAISLLLDEVAGVERVVDDKVSRGLLVVQGSLFVSFAPASDTDNSTIARELLLVLDEDTPTFATGAAVDWITELRAVIVPEGDLGIAGVLGQGKDFDLEFEGREDVALL